MTTPEQAFETYTAVKLHFQGTYDYVRYRGKLGRSRGALDSRNDRYKFEKLAKKRDVPLFVAANLVRKPRIWVGELVDDPRCDEVFEFASAFVESASYKIGEDIDETWGEDEEFDLALRSIDGEPPRIYTDVRAKLVHVETLALLDKLTGFSARARVTTDPTFDTAAQRMRRYADFLEVPDDVVRRVVLKKFPNGRRSA